MAWISLQSFLDHNVTGLQISHLKNANISSGSFIIIANESRIMCTIIIYLFNNFKSLQLLFY